MKELILTVSQHRKFGVVVLPFIIKPSEGSTFYSSIERANVMNVKEVRNFSDEHLQLVKLLNEYDDLAITEFFTKKKDIKTFIQNVDYDFVEKNIRPFIERRILKVNRILEKTKIRIFHQDRKYAHLYDEDEIRFEGNGQATAVFYFNRSADGIKYHLNIKNNNEEISLTNKKIMLLTQNPCSVVVNNSWYCFSDIDSKKLQPFFKKSYVQIPKQTEQTYFEKFIFNTICKFEVKAEGFDIIENTNPCKNILYLQNDVQGIPTLLQKYRYSDKIILPNNPAKVLLCLENKNDNYKFTKTTRNKDYEQQLSDNLVKMGLQSADNIHFYPQHYDVPNDDKLYALLQWVNANANKLKQAGVEVHQGFFQQKYMLDAISVNVNVSDEQDWFDIYGTIELGEFKVPFVKLRRNILKEIREYVLPNGEVAILPKELFVKYKELFLLAESDDKSLKLSKIHFGLLSDKTIGLNSNYAERIKNLFDTEQYDNSLLPNNINATLRPYQISGFNWLRNLQNHNFGGCLADDMGLGKTIQTLSILANSELDDGEQTPQATGQLSLFDEYNKTTKRASLIIMPASLIHNWKNEIKRFTPQLKVFVNSGQNRIKSLSSLLNIDVVLSTYGTIRNDFELLKEFQFNYVILDESQIIKNPNSKIYKAVVELKAKHKLVLTGTPIENSLTDLWSQMNFINKGLLGNFSFFKKEFVTPIEKHKDEQQSAKLQSLIQPFVLRRTKEQVAKYLPDKTEQTVWCDMTEKQKQIYDKELNLVRNSILEGMESDGKKASTVVVLQALTKLRQIANHPNLIDEDSDSGKFEEVTRILENIIAEKHKVLIFSSFVKHLNLFADYLTEQNIKYSMLTGQTANREEVIGDFQNNDDNQVFLISLKAGGSGLNLTAADYVFLLDPWWNPASENQAISRAHRIGQDKKVFVYKFISSDSIEEKIVNLQGKKSELADMFINTNNPFEILSAENIKTLFD